MGLSGQNSSARHLTLNPTSGHDDSLTPRTAWASDCVCEDLSRHINHLPRLTDTPGVYDCADPPWTESKENTDAARLCDHSILTQD